jgi:hypothetical protein
MQKQNHRFLPPMIVASIEPAMNSIVRRVGAGMRAGKMECHGAMKFDGGRLDFGRGEVEVCQQTLGFPQVQVPSVWFRHAGRRIVNGHAIKPLAHFTCCVQCLLILSQATDCN